MQNGLFQNCKNLKVIPKNILLSGETTGYITNCTDMFRNCTNLSGTSTTDISDISGNYTEIITITSGGFPAQQFWENDKITSYANCFRNTPISGIIQTTTTGKIKWYLN